MPDAGHDRQDLPPPIHSAPVTARWVYEILDRDGAHTPGDLVERTQCRRRTIHRALDDLRDADLVEASTDPDDPRRTRYVSK